MMNVALKTMSQGFKPTTINIYTTDCLMLARLWCVCGEKERELIMTRIFLYCDGNLAKGRGITKRAPSVMPEDLAHALKNNNSDVTW